jgi:hypothetical protein
LLGLLVYAALSGIYAGDGQMDFSAKGGFLWVETDHAAGYWRSGLAYRHQGGLNLDAEAGQLFSNLAWADLNGTLISFESRFTRKPWGLRLGAGFFFQSETEGAFDKALIKNEGGRGYYIGTSFSFPEGALVLTPSFVYGSGNWDEGSLYWFWGKPDVPAFWSAGLSAGLADHLLRFAYLSLDADILNNDGAALFDSHADFFSAAYAFSRRGAKNQFEGTLGGLYARGEIAGVLSAENQGYMLFPYGFYRIQGNFEALLIHGGVRLLRPLGAFQYKVQLGLVQALWGVISADIHYKEKKLFGGNEGYETLGLPGLGGTGAGFIRLAVAMPALPIGRGGKTRFSPELEKLFFIPWGYKKFLPSGEEETSGGGSGIQAGWLRTILLSGLSLSARLSF